MIKTIRKILCDICERETDGYIGNGGGYVATQPGWVVSGSLGERCFCPECNRLYDELKKRRMQEEQEKAKG